MSPRSVLAQLNRFDRDVSGLDQQKAFAVVVEELELTERIGLIVVFAVAGRYPTDDEGLDEEVENLGPMAVDPNDTAESKPQQRRVTIPAVRDSLV